MDYSINYSPDFENIELVQEKSDSSKTFIVIFMIFFGIVATIILLIFNKLATPFGFPFNMIPYFFIAIPVFIIFITFKQPNKSINFSQSLFFDNDKGYIKVVGQTPKQDYYLNYSEIKDFSFEKVKHTRSNNNSKTGSSSTRVYYTYHVYLQKTNDARWYLMTLGSEVDAIEKVMILKSKIKLDKKAESLPKILLPESIYKIESSEKSTISWKNNQSLINIILISLLIIAIAVGLGVFIYKVAQENLFSDFFHSFGIFFAIVFGFIISVFFFILVSYLINSVKNYSLTFKVLISRSSFEYQELEKDTERIKKSIVIKNQDVGSVLYTFNNINTTSVSNYINIIDVSNPMLNENNTTFLVDKVKNIFSKNKKGEGLELEFDAINANEALQVENWIVTQLNKYRNKRIQSI